MSRTPHTRAVLTALFVTLLWSTSWVLIKIALADLPPLTFAGLRYTLAALVLLPGLRRQGAALRALTRRDWVMLAALGLVFYTVTQGGQFATLLHLEAVTFSLVLNFTSVIVAVVGIFTLREVPAPAQWLGIVLFLGGVLVYFSPAGGLSGSPLGFLLAGITVTANAVSSLLGRAVNRGSAIPAGVVTTVSMGIGSLVLLAAGLILEPAPVLSAQSVVIIVVLAVVNTAAAFTLWNQSLQELSAVESSIINNTMLIQIAVLAWVFLGESLSALEIAGLALAAAGIYLANRRPKALPVR